MTTTIILPEMGEGVIEGTVVRWLVSEGQEVEEFSPIAEVETDKVTTEIITEESGIVLRLYVGEGETVPVDTALALIGRPESDEEGDRPEPPGLPANGRPLETPVEAEDQPVDSPRYQGRVSPVVGRIAAQHGVDLNLVSGTGREGRITKRDVLAYIETRPSTEEPQIFPPAEAADSETQQKDPDTSVSERDASAPKTQEAPPVPSEGEASLPSRDERQPLSAMRRLIAEHMVLSKQTSPHATTIFEFDFSMVAAHRAAHKERFARSGVRLTYTAYVMAAVVEALKGHPLVNSVWDEDAIILKHPINIGLAVAVPNGLLVPVIRETDGMNLLGLARAINDVARRARENKLLPADLKGGTFSITNHGTSGSLLATPIINQPQSGILGLGKIEKRVKVVDDAIAIRPLAYASFSFDHRILDGATADAFVSQIKKRLESWS